MESGLKLDPIYKGFPTKSLPRAQEGVVDSTPLRNVNLLVKNRDYSLVGGAAGVQADPAVLHFAGFEVGQLLTQRVRIINTSGFATRVNVLPAHSPAFRIAIVDKIGHLAPGMAETVEVAFSPTAFQYYNDAIRVHCGEDVFMVPIHAYPVAAGLRFPRSIDFGAVELGQRVTRAVQLTCSVPVEFEFRVRALHASADFSVEPAAGVVPASGSATVTVAYQPTSMNTHSTELELTLSQFEVAPMRCRVTGVSQTGATRARMLKEAVGAAFLDSEELSGVALLNEALRRALRLTDGGGAGHGDHFTEAKWAARRRSLEPMEVKYPNIPPKQADREYEDLETLLPEDLRSHASIAYIMNQEKGRLRIRDIKDAVASKRLELARIDDGLRLIAESSGTVDALDDEAVETSIKEALFRMRLAEASAHQSAVDSTFLASVGCDVPTDAQNEEYARAHSERQRAAQVSRELAACQQQHTQTCARGALHLKEIQRGAAAPRQHGHTGEGAPADTSEAGALGASVASTLSTAGGVLAGEAAVASYPGVPDSFAPTWSDAHHDSLDKRRHALDSFVAAARRVIVRNRASRHLRRIQNVLQQLNWSRDAVRDEVATPMLLSRDKMGGRPGVEPTRYLNPDNVRAWPFKRHRDVNFMATGAVEDGAYADYDELEVLPLKVPLAYKVKGYSPVEHWGFVHYVPPMLGQPLERGAPEETDEPRPTAEIPAEVDGVEYRTAGLELPESVRRSPFSIVEVGSKWARTVDGVVRAPAPVWGVDAAHPVQPAILPHYRSAAREHPASNAVRALTDTPLLAERWRARRQMWGLGAGALPAPMTGAMPSDAFELKWVRAFLTAMSTTCM